MEPGFDAERPEISSYIERRHMQMVNKGRFPNIGQVDKRLLIYMRDPQSNSKR